ncbi:MAG: bifunctional riboflavin kinase/FAD synthetase [Dehalococcoidia bacterium]|nr:bifunctional riboflavin kinase/FAD synthetase [Dehalococcoidia bacterium]
MEKLSPKRDTIVTIGVFDGVHKGHQSLIQTLKKLAAERNLLSVAMTFEIHPEEVIGSANLVPWLTHMDERVRLLRSLGVDLVTVMPFDREVAKLDARQFMGLLTKYLHMKGLVVGPDFALGKGRQGDAAALVTLGKEMGFTVASVPPLDLDGRVVSSTAVRQAVARGDAREYFKLVGRYYTICGEVIKGAERGRTLGFPTANLAIDPHRAVPADGVYVTWAHFDSTRHPSVTNIGRRPTFDNGERLAEVHVLDHQGDLYGKEMTVELVERLRDELRFNSVQELQERMKQDVEQSRSVLKAEEAK